VNSKKEKMDGLNGSKQECVEWEKEMAYNEA